MRIYNSSMMASVKSLQFMKEQQNILIKEGTFSKEKMEAPVFLKNVVWNKFLIGMALPYEPWYPCS